LGEPETVIRVENLSKRYVICHAADRGGYTTLRDTIAGGVRSLARRVTGGGDAARPTREEFWALKDVSFEVKRGEVVGVIGRNGAGKSTLLKVLSRITEPTSGRIEIDGRVASLLEVGTGFHPELSGRENIYLNGAILGMARTEIRRKFDEIVAFSEVERFLDTPVKRYSSGMYMRLAFAVSAHLEPEILVVDEVLSVGDAAFQQKCLGKMGEVARHGRTVLFVSHNMQAVASLCGVAVLLRQGELVRFGPTEFVQAEYLARDEKAAGTKWSGRDGSDDLALLSAEVIGSSGDLFRTDHPVRVQVRYQVGRPLMGVVCAVEVYNRQGTRLLYTAVDDLQAPPPPVTPPGTYAWELTIPANVFSAGAYKVDFDLGIHNVR
jgi:lipopolysaccharide transport system ATP-binding protein